MGKKSLIQEVRDISNYEYNNRRANYRAEFANCKEFLKSEAADGKRGAIYVINANDPKYLDGWISAEYLQYAQNKLAQNGFNVTIKDGKMYISW